MLGSARQYTVWLRMRRKYDLREQLVGLERRNAAAKEAAQGFVDALTAGQLDPKGPDFNQGQGTSTEAAAEYAPPASSAFILTCHNGCNCIWGKHGVCTDLHSSHKCITP